MKNPFTHKPYYADLACHGHPEAKTLCHRGRVANEKEILFAIHAIERHDALAEGCRKALSYLAARDGMRIPGDPL